MDCDSATHEIKYTAHPEPLTPPSMDTDETGDSKENTGNSHFHRLPPQFSPN